MKTYATNRFSNFTKAEILFAKKRAFSFLFSIENVLFNKRFNYDARFRTEVLAAKIVHDTQIDRILIKKLWKSRKQNKAKFNNVLSNPIVVDFKQNKPCKVLSDRLVFGQRNHWAKNNFDFKILSILQKSSIVS